MFMFLWYILNILHKINAINFTSVLRGTMPLDPP